MNQETKPTVRTPVLSEAEALDEILDGKVEPVIESKLPPRELLIKLLPGEFRTWKEARDYAQEQANKLGVAHGIEKPTSMQAWTVKMLPRPENRYGWETQCEAVEPTIQKPAPKLLGPGSIAVIHAKGEREAEDKIERMLTRDPSLHLEV